MSTGFFLGFSTWWMGYRMTGGAGQTWTPLGYVIWVCYKSSGGLTPNGGLEKSLNVHRPIRTMSMRGQLEAIAV
jgi:hypothetical protein